MALLLQSSIKSILCVLWLTSSSSPSSFTCHAQPSAADANALLEEGNEAYGAGDLLTAARRYESCLITDPTLHYCAVNLASVLIDTGDEAHLPRAEELYRSALKVDPSDPDTSFNLAMLLQDKKTEEATEEAAKLYKVSVEQEPHRWDCWANLAAALSEMGTRPLEAIQAYERSILIIERAAEESGEGENVERDRYLSKLYYGYGVQLSDLTAEACKRLADDERSLLIGNNERNGDDDMKRLCTEAAQNALRSAVILDATNAQASHMLAAISAEDGGDDGVHRRASPEFVAALFDDFASTFDEKLGALEYRVPGIIGATAAKARGEDTKFVSVLDAGAGTGLAGRFLRPIVTGPMVGVDISQKMLDKAAKCTLKKGCGIDEEADDSTNDEEDAKLYDGLVALDLEAMTLEETLLAPGVTRSENLSDEDKRGFDLVVAADVLVYFGRLESVLGNFAKLSKPGSSLMFTCERATEEEAPLGYRLLTSGRFSHTKDYVLKVATDLGYGLASYEEIVPRMEKGKEVKGHIFHFVLSDGGSGVREEL